MHPGSHEGNGPSQGSGGHGGHGGMGMRGVSRPMAEQAMGSGHGEGGLNATLVGLALVVLSVPRGPKTERYGAWDHYIR